jgi:hypothetical protein
LVYNHSQQIIPKLYKAAMHRLAWHLVKDAFLSKNNKNLFCGLFLIQSFRLSSKYDLRKKGIERAKLQNYFVS